MLFIMLTSFGLMVVHMNKCTVTVWLHHKDKLCSLQCVCVCVCTDTEKRAQYIEEDRHMREENIRLQRKLQREVERREALCRQLSESESSLEMDDERYSPKTLHILYVT